MLQALKINPKESPEYVFNNSSTAGINTSSYNKKQLDRYVLGYRYIHAHIYLPI
jgi:hypothetical protein